MLRVPRWQYKEAFEHLHTYIELSSKNPFVWKVFEILYPIESRNFLIRYNGCFVLTAFE